MITGLQRTKQEEDHFFKNEVIKLEDFTILFMRTTHREIAPGIFKIKTKGIFEVPSTGDRLFYTLYSDDEKDVMWEVLAKDAWVDFRSHKSWMINNFDVDLHNPIGPAVISSFGKVWAIDGEAHRLGAPATISFGENNCWYYGWFLDGIWYSKEDYIEELRKRGEADAIVDAMFWP